MTYEQLINVLKTYQQNHKILKSFFEGYLWDFDQTQERLYPVMTAVIEPSPLDNNKESFTLSVGFFDKVELDDRNRINAISDMKLLCKDFVALCKSPKLMATGLRLQMPVNPEPFVEKFNDRVAGWMFAATLYQFEAYDNCIAPYVQSPPVASLGVEIIDQDGNVLATLYPGQQYSVDVVTAILQTLVKPPPRTIIQKIT